MPLEDPEGDGRGILFLFLSSIINLFLNYIDDLKIFLHRTLVNILWIRQKFQSLKSYFDILIYLSSITCCLFCYQNHMHSAGQLLVSILDFTRN